MGINATEAPDYFADAPGYATHEVLNQAGALAAVVPQLTQRLTGVAHAGVDRGGPRGLRRSFCVGGCRPARWPGTRGEAVAVSSDLMDWRGSLCR